MLPREYIFFLFRKSFQNFLRRDDEEEMIRFGKIDFKFVNRRREWIFCERWQRILSPSSKRDNQWGFEQFVKRNENMRTQNKQGALSNGKSNCLKQKRLILKTKLKIKELTSQQKKKSNLERKKRRPKWMASHLKGGSQFCKKLIP